MTQFCVYRLPDGLLVMDLQSDLVDTGTRVVAPLMPADGDLPVIRGLEPVFEIAGQALALRTGDLAAIPARLVAGEVVADLGARDYDIRRALDLVFSGV